MAKIGLVVRSGTQEAVELGLELCVWAKERGHEVILEQDTATAIKGKHRAVPAEDLARVSDPIVALGGDGTLIGVARHVNGDPPLMLGVNFGRLGFLTEVSPTEFFPVLEQVLEGKARVGQRNMLLARLFRKDKVVFQSQAVNDCVIHKGARDPLMDVDVEVDGEMLVRTRADGLIVATPTGSTAYSLAAGGSIAYPTLPLMLLTPICPHSLTNRPLILSDQSMLRISVPSYSGEIFVSVDGQSAVDAQVGDVLEITKSSHSVIFVRSPSKSYFEILRKKLNWGVGTEER